MHGIQLQAERTRNPLTPHDSIRKPSTILYGRGSGMIMSPKSVQTPELAGRQWPGRTTRNRAGDRSSVTPPARVIGTCAPASPEAHSRPRLPRTPPTPLPYLTLIRGLALRLLPSCLADNNIVFRHFRHLVAVTQLNTCSLLQLVSSHSLAMCSAHL